MSFLDAILENDLRLVKELLVEGRVDPRVKNNFVIGIASQKGRLEIVRLLLTEGGVDPSANRNFAINCASGNGHLEVVKLLLADSRVNPGDNNNNAIKWASENGHSEVVKLLLTDPRVDPSAGGNYAIAWASGGGHLKVVKLLEEDQVRYPTFEIRKHNLPLDQKINKIKKQMEDVYILNLTTTNSLIREALSVVYSNLELQISPLEKLKM